MIFRTPVTFQHKKHPNIKHAQSLLSLGSCFSEHMGNKLIQGKFDCQINPYGVLYNPFSIAKALSELIEKKTYQKSDLFEFNGKWHSWMHHSSFSSYVPEQAVQNINTSLDEAHTRLVSLDYLFITWGSAWVYRKKADYEVVSNCHKVPGNQFERSCISVSEIVDVYSDLIRRIVLLNPKVKIVFSVSPIRHLRDGMHANQISKGTLLLAINELCQIFSNQVSYFPSYEIVIDELRDYRFYSDDMVHPSSLAIDYIWLKFQEVFFDTETISIVKACEQIHKSLEHRPSNPNAPSYHSFLQHLVEEMEHISIKYPTLDFRKEINKCLMQLKK